MNFTQDSIEFPSMVHQIIYSSAREIIPLETTTREIVSPELRTSCKAYYHFIMDMLSDMYDHPLEYQMPVHELEDFVGTNTINGMKQKYPSKTKLIISRTRNSVERYMGLLSRLGCVGTVHDDQLEVSNDYLPTLEKIVNTSSSPIPLTKRLEALSRVGLKQTDQGFISTKYPNMFPAMCALAEKTKGSASGFHYYQFTKLDYRNIAKNYKPTYVDYFQPLVQSRREVADGIHTIATECGARPTIHTFLKVDYKYKGSQVMLIDTSNGNLDIRITETYAWDKKEPFEELLKEKSEGFQRDALRHLWRCTACSTSHLGPFITILDKKNRVCGGGQIGFVWNNPTAKDLDIIKELIRIRCELIKESTDKK